MDNLFAWEVKGNWELGDKQNVNCQMLYIIKLYNFRCLHIIHCHSKKYSLSHKELGYRNQCDFLSWQKPTMSISTANCPVVRIWVWYDKNHKYLIVLCHSIPQFKNGFQLCVQQHKPWTQPIFCLFGTLEKKKKEKENKILQKEKSGRAWWVFFSLL